MIESEADRLGIKAIEIYPRTGIKEFDDLITRNMGPIVTQTHFDLITSDAYERLPFKAQRAFFKKMLSEAKRASTEIARGERPDLAMRDMLNRADDIIAKDLEAALESSNVPVAEE